MEQFLTKMSLVLSWFSCQQSPPVLLDIEILHQDVLMLSLLCPPYPSLDLSSLTFKCINIYFEITILFDSVKQITFPHSDSSWQTFVFFLYRLALLFLFLLTSCESQWPSTTTTTLGPWWLRYLQQKIPSTFPGDWVSITNSLGPVSPEGLTFDFTGVPESPGSGKWPGSMNPNLWHSPLRKG